MPIENDDKLFVRMPRPLKARLEEIAHADRRPVANLARAVLEQFCATQAAQHPPGADHSTAAAA